MTGTELTLCLSAVVSSSTSQLFIKGAVVANRRLAALTMFSVGAALLCVSVVLTVLALQTLPLPLLVSFAAIAYVLVPLGSSICFGERPITRFWLGAAFIVIGIIWIHI